MNKFIPSSVRYLIHKFNESGYDIRLVGGCVRDYIMNIVPKDIDLCTNATPDQMIEVCKEHNMSYIPTGIDFGTISIKSGDIYYEVTTLRSDTSCNGRHAEVKYISDFKEDAMRRDLTINAMSMDINYTVYDYFDGKKDIENKLIKFVGNSKDRIEEDYLRLLRAFRFSSRYDFKIDSNIIDLCYDQNIHEGLKTVSKERYWKEFSEIFESNNKLEIIKLIFDSKLNDVFEFDNFDEILINNAANFVECYSALFSKKFDYNKHKMPKDYGDKVNYLIENRNVNVDDVWTKEQLLTVEKDCLISLYNLKGIDNSFIKNYDVPKFPINGNILMENGIEKGPKMGEVFKKLRRIWIDSDYTMNVKELIERI